MDKAQREPVALMALLNTALAATWGLLVILFDIRPEVSGAVIVLIGAWLAVAGWFTRKFTTPVGGEV